MSDFVAKTDSFRILSLDGGGIRGTFIASYLAEIEEHLERPIYQYFDLIAGASTGGIIALALSMGVPARKILELYRDHGSEIFARRKALPVPTPLKPFTWIFDQWGKGAGYDFDMLHQPKFDSNPLRKALEQVLGDRTMEQAQCRVVVPAVDLIGGKPIVFKTPHEPDFIRDRKHRAVDVALAATAAPLFFQHASLGQGSAYIDGGVWANNPSLVAYVEATRIRERSLRPEDPQFELSGVRMLSIGTGSSQLFAEPPAKGAGIIWWLRHFLNVVTLSQAQGVETQMHYLLDANIHRVNFKMPQAPWMLDDVQRIPTLIHHGREQATSGYPLVRSTFFESPAKPFVPYPM